MQESQPRHIMHVCRRGLCYTYICHGVKVSLPPLHFTKTRNRGPDLRTCNVPGQMGNVPSSQEGTKIHWGALTALFLWGEHWMTLTCLSLSCNSSICREDSIGCLFGGSYYYKTSAEPKKKKKPKTQFVLIYIEKTSEYFYVWITLWQFTCFSSQ